MGAMVALLLLVLVLALLVVVVAALGGILSSQPVGAQSCSSLTSCCGLVVDTAKKQLIFF